MKLTVLAIVLAFSTFAFGEGTDAAKSAAPTDQGQQKNDGSKGGGHRPPREALDACQSKKAGDACTFESPHGAVTGTCFTPESSKPLACKPSQPPVR